MRPDLAAWTLALPMAIVCGPPAVAQSVEERLGRLEATLGEQQRTIEAQKREIETLRRELASSRSQSLGSSELAPQVAELQAESDRQRLAEQDRARLSLIGGRPVISSFDGRNTLAVRGLVQLDAAHYRQGAEGPLASDFRRGSVGAGGRETNGARDLSDGAYFRRARIGVEGVVNRDFGYRLIAELGGSGAEGPARLNDAWVSYTGIAPFTFQIGAFSPPANMDDGTSPEDTLFVERAAVSELSRVMAGADGRIGAGARFATARWMGALTFTSRTVGDAEAFDSQRAVVGRVGRLLASSDTYNVHVGASGAYVISPADLGSSAAGARRPVRLRDRPELRVDGTRLIDTGPIDADHAHVVGAEFAAQYRNLYVQTEAFHFGIDRSGVAVRNPTFAGYYVQGSWVLTGEPRRYNMASGGFQSPRPLNPLSRNGGLGAWELAARYSRIDLNDRAGAPGSAAATEAVRGGDQRVWTLGLNWYPNPNVRFMLDYLDIDVQRLNPAGAADASPFGAGAATPPVGVEIGQRAKALVLRSQYGF